MISLLGTALILLSAVLATVFCPLYHLTAPWRDSEAGRHIMSFTAVIALVLDLWTIGALTPAHGQWWQIVRIIAFALVPVVLGWRLWMLWRLQIRPELFRRKP